LASNPTRSYGGEDEDFCYDLEMEIASWEEEIRRVDGLMNQIRKVGTSLRLKLTFSLTRSEETLDWMANWVRRFLIEGDGEKQNQLMISFELDIITNYMELQTFYKKGIIHTKSDALSRLQRLTSILMGEFWGLKNSMIYLLCTRAG